MPCPTCRKCDIVAPFRVLGLRGLETPNAVRLGSRTVQITEETAHMAQKTGLEAELSVSSHIDKAESSGSKIDLDVLVALRNHDEDSRVVQVADPDSMHFWQLLDEDHKEVQRGRPKTAATESDCGTHPSFTETIAPEHPLYSTHKVTINPKKLKHGKNYTLRWVLWDQYPAEQQITIPRRPTVAKSTRKKPR